jgi:hypothetical protein
MKKYLVGIREVNYGSGFVEANNKEEAEEAIMDVYYSGDIHWLDSDITEIDVEEVYEHAS